MKTPKEKSKIHLMIGMIGFIVTIFLMMIFGCTKETNDPVNADGNYSGIMTFEFQNNLVEYAVNRCIRGDSSTWYTSPPVVSEFRLTGNRYSIIYEIDKTGTCQDNDYRHLWVYTGSGEVRNDSLFESGTYDYKYFNKGTQVIHKIGTWTAKFGKTTIWRPL